MQKKLENAHQILFKNVFFAWTKNTLKSRLNLKKLFIHLGIKLSRYWEYQFDGMENVEINNFLAFTPDLAWSSSRHFPGNVLFQKIRYFENSESLLLLFVIQMNVPFSEKKFLFLSINLFREKAHTPLLSPLSQMMDA